MAIPFESTRTSTGGGGGVSDHGLLLGLGDDDHTQYSKLSAGVGAPASTPSRAGALYTDTTGSIPYYATGNVSSADWSRLSQYGHTHSTSDIISGTFADSRIAQTNVTQHEAAINHNTLTNYLANEHIDWTSTTQSITTTGTITAQDVMTISGTATQGGRLRLSEDTNNGTNYMELRANSNILANFTLTFPSSDGNPGEFLKTDGSGILTWSSVTASPGGLTTNVQFNNAGALDGDANFTTDGIGNVSITGSMTVDFLT